MSYESTSVFVFRLFSCDLENTKIEEALKSGKKLALVLALLAAVVMQITE